MPQTELPSRPCDLVMKGGATSGVVYPSALHEIAGKFNLSGIGGTSAGARGAVAAAAAEYRRRTTRTNDGFDQLTLVRTERQRPFCGQVGAGLCAGPLPWCRDRHVERGAECGGSGVALGLGYRHAAFVHRVLRVFSV